MVRYSSGTVQKRAQDKSLKELSHDGALYVYTGVQPSDADNAVTGTLLAKITKDSVAFNHGTKSVRQVDQLIITSFAENETFSLTIAGVVYTYTAGAGSSTSIIAKGLAILVDEDTAVIAVANGANIVIRARFGGQTLTITKGGTGTSTLTNLEAAVRGNGLQFGTAALGVLAKDSSTWSGVVLANGTAGWWRYKANPVDDDLLSTTAVRIDGSCSTSLSADGVMTATGLVKDTTLTIGTFNITEPKSK